jgi:hypothetical protein
MYAVRYHLQCLGDQYMCHSHGYHIMVSMILPRCDWGNQYET